MKTLPCLLLTIPTLLLFAGEPGEITFNVGSELKAPNPTIQRIILTAGDETLSSSDAPGVYFQGDLEPLPALQAVLEEQFLQQPLDIAQIETMKQTILQEYKREGKNFIAVQIPDQEITKGSVSFKINQAKVGKVTYAKPKWFSQSIFEKYFNLHTGDVLNREHLLNTASWLNRNPFHRSEIVLTPGQFNRSTDVDIVTRDRFPLKVYAGADNSGNRFTKRARLFTGVHWGDAFMIDDILSFQYTGSPDFHRFTSYYANYTCYLPWKHTLAVYGAFAMIHPQIEFFHSLGKNWQLSTRYSLPFKPLWTPLQHELKFGYDYKNTNSNLFFTETEVLPIATHSANLTEFYLGYLLERVSENHRIFFRIETLFSPYTWLVDQNKSTYAQLRPGANPKYIYGRTQLGHIWRLPYRFSFSWLVRGQLSSGALLPSEQLALGGYETVRGYNEMAYNADNAFIGNVEFHLPYFYFGKTQPDRGFFMWWFDFGVGHNYHSQPGFFSHETLYGTGPGFRYNVSSYLNLRADYGFQLRHIPGDDHFGVFHLGAVGSY